MWNPQISRFLEVLNFFFLLQHFDTVLYDLIPEKFTNIWQIEQDWITVKKFATPKTHFLSEVSASIAVLVVLKAH